MHIAVSVCVQKKEAQPVQCDFWWKVDWGYKINNKCRNGAGGRISNTLHYSFPSKHSTSVPKGEPEMTAQQSLKAWRWMRQASS